MGILLHVFKDSKYEEYLKQSKAQIHDNLWTNSKEEVFWTIFQSLKDSYFFDQEIGNETNLSENIRYFDQAWKVFEKEEISDLPEAEKLKLYRHLFEKYVKWI